MITVRQTWIGLIVLFVIMLLIVVASLYWQHITGTNFLHILADGDGPQPVGC